MKNLIDEIFDMFYSNNENPSKAENISYAILHAKDLFFNEKTYVGEYGEWLIEYKIHNNIKGYYKLHKNVYVPYENNKKTEIDIILVHEKGIFIIESKNFTGWIFGDEKQKYWTQCLTNKEHRQFYNPILQNQTHINILSKNIKIKRERMKSFIVFSERCELKKVPANSETFTIIKRNKFTETIINEISKKETMFTKKQVDFISSKIEKFTNISEKERQEHISEIKKKSI